jgi:hypothetical protein
MEEDTGDVVEVTAESVNFPGLGVVHAPDLDLAIVGAGDDEREGRVEGGPVDTTVVALKDILDNSVAASEEVGVDLLREAEDVVGGGGGRLATDATDVPDADGLVEGGRDNEVVRGVEGGGHDVVVVPSEDANALAGLPVPDADSLVVGGGEQPRAGVVEVHSANVV